MFKYGLSAMWLLLAVPAYGQAVPDLQDLDPDALPAAPENNNAMDLSIGKIYTSGEPDREINGCIVPGRPDWIIEINPSRNIEQWLVSAIWRYLGGSRVVETEDCSCELRFPSWADAIDYFDENYAGMERVAMNNVRLDYGPKSREMARKADDICQEGYR